MKHASMLPVLLVAGMLGIGSASAQTAIPGLFDTGVNNSGDLLGAGAVDPHYALVDSPGGAYGPSAFAASPIPASWIANSSESRWIAPTVNQGVFSATTPAGNYFYRLSFDLTGLDPATASISGNWATDNSGQIFINGLPTANLSGSLSTFTAFSVAAGFSAGVNHLDFLVTNAPHVGANPTGLRVEDISGMAMAIPEPETYALLLAGLGLLGFAARRRLKGGSI